MEEEEHGGRAGAGMLGQRERERREKERTKSLELLQHKNERLRNGAHVDGVGRVLVAKIVIRRPREGPNLCAAGVLRRREGKGNP